MSVSRYPSVTRWLHRVIALLVIGMIGVGAYLSGLEYEDPQHQVLLQWHRLIGLLLFPLGLAHLLAYAFLPRPAFSVTLKPHERVLAKLAHMFLLYVVIAIPVAGYLMSGDKLVIVGDSTVPAVVVLDKALRKTLFDVHATLAWLAAGVVAVHILAALKHHIIDKDDTLTKMR
jgi:cytochrome b561